MVTTYDYDPAAQAIAPDADSQSDAATGCRRRISPRAALLVRRGPRYPALGLYDLLFEDRK